MKRVEGLVSAARGRATPGHERVGVYLDGKLIVNATDAGSGKRGFVIQRHRLNFRGVNPKAIPYEPVARFGTVTIYEASEQEWAEVQGFPEDEALVLALLGADVTVVEEG